MFWGKMSLTTASSSGSGGMGRKQGCRLSADKTETSQTMSFPRQEWGNGLALAGLPSIANAAICVDLRPSVVASSCCV
jgi:hypothetical protein